LKVIGVDPEGSILAGPAEIKSYKVEGIGYDFIPDVLDRSLVDEWIKSNDRDSFRTARKLIRQEGLLVGGSSGAAVWAAQKVARAMKPGQRVVVILPDSIRNYLTKFVSDAWMRQHGFVESDYELGTIGDVLRTLRHSDVVSVAVDDRLRVALDKFRKHGISQMPVVDNHVLAGIITESDLLQHLVTGHASEDTTVAEVMERRVSTVALHAGAGELPRIFERGEVALVVDDKRHVLGIITKLDLIEILAARRRVSHPPPPA
jgi:cystathionine beta-synthase